MNTDSIQIRVHPFYLWLKNQTATPTESHVGDY